MSDLYSTPMAGSLPIFWSLATDEEGTPEGYVGTPKSADDIDEPVRECLGSDIYFASSLRCIDDKSLAISIERACMHAVGKYVMPKLVSFMYHAAIELREREGGFSQEMHEARVAQLQAEQADSEDED